MDFQRVSIVLNFSNNENVPDFYIERFEELKLKLQESPAIKSQRIKCEKCHNQLELSLRLQNNLVLVKEEPREDLFHSEWENKFESLLETEEKPDVVTLPLISTIRKARKRKGKRGKRKPKLECDLCNQKFYNKQKIAAHMRKIHRVKHELPSKEYCYLCFKYVSRKKFKNHLMLHSEATFECDICHKKYQTRTKIFNHMKLEHLERPNVKTCQFCGKRFLRKEQLLDHIVRHENLRQFKCDQCPKDFNTSRALNQHKIKIHKTEESPMIYCHICGHASYFKGDFERHKKIHLSDEEKPYHCSHCSKKFTSKHNFERHVMVHTGEKPLKCEICFKAFREQHVFQDHLRKHKGEKPFICPIPGCDKRYAERSCYRAHLKLHERELKITLDKSTWKFDLGTHKTTMLSNMKNTS